MKSNVRDNYRSIRQKPGLAVRPGLSFFVLCALFLVLLIAGGASRADATGQVVIRCAAWLALIVTALFADFTESRGIWPLAVILFLAVLLVVLQIIPLPPAVWQNLPGRERIVDAAVLSGQPQPWRPLSMVPGATRNAGWSLVVPVAVFVLANGLRQRECSWLLTVVLALVIACMLVGLLQFSGASFDNPFVNDSPGQVSGLFANRNHFALFLAMGCLLAPAWALEKGATANLRWLIALGLVVVFVLTILATGSRAGMALGMIALGVGLALVRHDVGRALQRQPRGRFYLILIAVLFALIIPVLFSISAGRAGSIDRMLTVGLEHDMRGRGLPIVLNMVRDHLPWGTGIGGFDPLFRMYEPFALLKLTYFNHAHNDWLEIALDAGMPGVALEILAVLWWSMMSVRAWRAGSEEEHIRAKLGSALILLVFIASLFDYPARTPIIMALLMLSAVWLAKGTAQSGAVPLRHTASRL